MTRLALNLGFGLLGAMFGSPIALAQEPAKPDSAAKEPVAEAKADFIKSADLIVTGGEPGTQVVTQGQPSLQPFGGQGITDGVKYTRQNPAGPRNQNQVVYTTTPRVNGGRSIEPFGMSLEDADGALRAQLQIPDGEGVVVATIKPHSLAEDVGLKVNDVILSLKDLPARNAAEVENVLLGLNKEAIGVKLIRQGKRTQLSIVGPEHGFVPQPTEYWIGVPVSPVDATLRAHLPSLPADAGLVANDVVKDSPAEAAGLKKNDILISLAESKPLSRSEDLIAAIQASGGKAVPLEILRAGKLMTLTVTPAKRTQSKAVSVMTSADGQSYRLTSPYSTVVYSLNHIQNLQGVTAGQTTVATVRPPLAETAPAKSSAGQEPSSVAIDQFHAELLRNKINEMIQLKLVTNPVPPQVDEKTAKIEAELKEVSTKLDEILKELKKTEKK